MNLDSKLIFVGGSPRSGTSLVRRILDSHPDICSGPEFDSIPDILRLWWMIAQRVESERISVYLNQEQLRNSFSNLILSLLEPYRIKKGKLHIAEKTPRNILVFPLLNSLLPQAYLVHVIRDGRDVVPSMLEVYSHYRRRGERMPLRDVETAARMWIQYVSAPRADEEIFRSKAFQEKYTEIRYEDIIQDPERTLRHLCERLSVDFSPNMLSPELYSHDNVIDNRWWTEDTVKAAVHDSSLGRWRRDLTLFQRVVVARHCQPYFLYFGYASDGKWVWDNWAERIVSDPLGDCLTVGWLIYNWFLRCGRSFRTKILEMIR